MKLIFADFSGFIKNQSWKIKECPYTEVDGFICEVRKVVDDLGVLASEGWCEGTGVRRLM